MNSAILQFDEVRLINSLERLATSSRHIFAASCAERLMPAYLRFAGRTGTTEAAHRFCKISSQLWLDLEGSQKLDGVAISSLIEECMELIPTESGDNDEQWIDEQAAGEDAAAALAYALRCRSNGQAKEAAWSARRAYEALDHYVINKDDIDTNQAGAEEKVIRHSLIQSELVRQRRDLNELSNVMDIATESVASAFRERAQREGIHFFGL